MADWEQLRVADVMTIDPITIQSDASIEAAERVLRLNGVTGLPVVDTDGDLVGVISQTDLVLAGSPFIEAALRNQPDGLRVGELMTSPAITVPFESSLREAARQMVEARVHRLVAVDEDGRAIGVLSAIDFVGVFAEG